jgi:hypothetical protein
MSMSLDGFVGTPSGEVEWIFRSFDDELTKYMVELLVGGPSSPSPRPHGSQTTTTLPNVSFASRARCASASSVIG